MPHHKRLSNASKCACGSNLKFIKCCGLYIKQGLQAPTAESLMRSRYSAYVLHDEIYLLNSWHLSTRPSRLTLEDDNIEWTKLEVIANNAGTENHNNGTVEFCAHYRSGGQKLQLHEVSFFLKENNQWFYVDGSVS